MITKEEKEHLYPFNLYGLLERLKGNDTNEFVTAATTHAQIKKLLMDKLTEINIEEMAKPELIPSEIGQKWFKFGAYDMERRISQEIIDL